MTSRWCYKCVRLVLLICALIATAGVAFADVFLEARLVVNRLPGNQQSDEDIYDLVRGVNNIFSKCPGEFSFTLASSDISNLSEYPPGFDHDAQDEIVPCALDDEEMWKASASEILHGGYKVFLAHSILGGINGESFLDKPISLVSQKDGFDGDNRTWAHEIAHGLGLDHVDDPDNLMFPNRTKQDGTPAGTSLTGEQCQKLIGNFTRLGPIVEIAIDQLGLVDPGESVVTLTTVSSEPRERMSGAAAKQSGHLDVHGTRAVVFTSSERNELELELFLSDAFPRDRPVDATYVILLNTDQNDGTGPRLRNTLGVDKIILMEVRGRYPFIAPHGSIIASVGGSNDTEHLEPGVDWLRPPDVEEPTPLPPPLIVEHPKMIDPGVPLPDVTTAVTVPSKFDESIRITVPLETLGALAGKIDIGIDILSSDSVASVLPFAVLTRQQRPEAIPSSLRVIPEEPVTLRGSGFSPNANLELFWENDFTKSMALGATDAQGAFTASINIPQQLLAGNRLADVIDEHGKVDIIVFTIEEAGISPPSRNWRLFVLLVSGVIGVLILFFIIRTIRRR